MRMPQMSGLQLQEELRRRGIVLPLVFVTAHGDVPLAVEAMRQGAANFLQQPFGEAALVHAIRAALAPSSEDRRVGQARVSPRSSRGPPTHYTQQPYHNTRVPRALAKNVPATLPSKQQP